jgi:autotransporter-associated beta strand protein
MKPSRLASPASGAARSAAAFALFSALAALPASDAFAAVKTWDGGGGATRTWGTAANWDGDVAPVGGDSLVFNTPLGGTVTNDLAEDTVIAGITLDGYSAAQTFGASNRFVLGGNFLVTNNTGTVTHTFNISHDLSATRTYQIDGSGITLNLSGGIVVSGTGGITKTGSGTLRLSGTAANTYSGLTTINAGTVSLQKTAGVNAIAGDVLVNNGGTLAWAASNQVADTSTITIKQGANVNFAGATETVGALVADDTGATGTGFTIGSGSTVSAGSVNVVNWGSAGRLAINIGGSNSGVVTSLTVGSGGLSIGNQVVVLNAGTGSNLGSRLALNGGVTVSHSNAQIKSNAAVPGGSSVTEIALGAESRTFHVVNAGDALRIYNDALSGSSNVNITGAGGIIKTGLGSLAIETVNSFTGAVDVQGGTFRLAAAGSVNSASGITVGSAGRFDQSSSVAFNKALTAHEGAILTGTGSINPSSFTIAGDLANGFTAITVGASTTLTKSGVLDFLFTNTSEGTYALFTGGAPTGLFSGVSISGNALASTDGNATFSGTVGAWDYLFTNATNTLQVTSAIPEPSSAALLAGLAMLGVGASRRRRR